MKNVGVIEGFFGPSWPMEERKSYATFLSQHGGSFYIYAPKQDANLRRNWREDWSLEYLNQLKYLVQTFHSFNIRFGVGFSPFGIGTQLSKEDSLCLKTKVKILSDLNVDILGIFFDDMPTNDNLAHTQIETVKVVKECFSQKIIFCPSYYSTDPILDKVFGKRPDHYLETIGEEVPLDVSIVWTGPKVISPDIDSKHLNEITTIIKRKPFLWDNLYANDGPKNCKFLKMKFFEGRSMDILQHSEAIGLNMMNQPELSKVLFLSSRLVLNGEDPESALGLALDKLCTFEFKKFFLNYREQFLINGVDSFSSEKKMTLIDELKTFSDKAALEIIEWLEGRYVVGAECLTD